MTLVQTMVQFIFNLNYRGYHVSSKNRSDINIKRMPQEGYDDADSLVPCNIDTDDPDHDVHGLLASFKSYTGPLLSVPWLHMHMGRKESIV